MPDDLQLLSDEELVARCQAEFPRGSVWFNELIRRYEPLVFGSCLRILKNAQDAEEATQDVFLRLFKKINLFEGRSKFKTWFFRLAHNVTFEVRKRIMRRVNREEEIVENMQEASGEPISNGNGGLVFDVLETMEEDQREILLLRFASDLEFSQMADILGSKLSATKMRFYRALECFEEKFREVLADQPTSEPSREPTESSTLP